MRMDPAKTLLNFTLLSDLHKRRSTWISGYFDNPYSTEVLHAAKIFHKL